MQIFHLVYGSAESWRSTGSRGKRSGGRLPNCPVQSQTRTVASKVCVTTYINCKTRFIKLKRSGSQTWGHGLSSRPIRRAGGGGGGLKREVQEKHTQSLILSCILTGPFSFPSKPKKNNDVKSDANLVNGHESSKRNNVNRILKITPVLDILLEYKRNWIQHVNRMPRNRLPRVMKHYSPTGRRNHGRPLKGHLNTWDRNGSTGGPPPSQIWWWWWWCGWNIMYPPPPLQV